RERARDDPVVHEAQELPAVLAARPPRQADRAEETGEKLLEGGALPTAAASRPARAWTGAMRAQSFSARTRAAPRAARARAAAGSAIAEATAAANDSASSASAIPSPRSRPSAPTVV